MISAAWESICFVYLKKPNIFVDLPTEEFWHEFEKLLFWLSTFLDLQIPPNLELVIGNW